MTEIDAQAVIEQLQRQRNAALDELALVKAQVVTLRAQLAERNGTEQP